tara:strand:+ start:105 stop:896 length:792 start_codon:yes stop_codon:yes gene_type:complete
MIIKKLQHPTKSEKILSDSNDFSLPLRSMNEVFDEPVIILKSIKIKDSYICDERYFAGSEVIKRKDVSDVCKKMSIPEKALGEISSVNSIDQCWIGVQQDSDEVVYRVYFGNFDEHASAGYGKAIEWKNNRKRFKVREYFGSKIISLDDLKNESLEILNYDADINDAIFQLVFSLITEGNILNETNLVRSKSLKRNSLDISLKSLNKNIHQIRSQISNIFESFNLMKHEYYKIFLSPTVMMQISRIQWGIDRDGEKFVNLYYV